MKRPDASVEVLHASCLRVVIRVIKVSVINDVALLLRRRLAVVTHEGGDALAGCR